MSFRLLRIFLEAGVRASCSANAAVMSAAIASAWGQTSRMRGGVAAGPTVRMQVLFAGGIHDAMSAAWSRPRRGSAVHGVRIGV